MEKIISPFALIVSTILCSIALACLISIAAMHLEARGWVHGIDARIETARAEVAEMQTYCQSVVDEEL